MRRLAILIVATAAALAVPTPGRAAATFNVPAADCNPSADSAPAIEAFLAGVPDGSTVVFPAGGRCQVDPTVNFAVPPQGQSQRTDTVFDLNGATLFRTSEPACRKNSECNRAIIGLLLANGVTIENGTLQGGSHVSGLPHYDSTREQDHGVAIHGDSDITLSGLAIRDVAGDCVDVDRQKRVDTANVTIMGTPSRPFSCIDAGRQGISANSTDGLRIENVTFDRIAESAVDLEGRHHGFLKNIDVVGNRFGWITNYAIAGIGATPMWQDITVSGNVQTDPAHPGLGFLRAGNSFDRGPLMITGNRMLNIVQINHTSGRATGNTLLAPARHLDCWFELFNNPPFAVQGNTVPKGVSETCARVGRIAGPIKPLVKKLKLVIVIFGIAILVLGLAVGLLVRRYQRRHAEQYDG